MEELTPELLISAYAQGIFPMGDGDDIHWYSPDPRTILPLDGFHTSKTLQQTYRSGQFEIRVNTAFDDVIRQCAIGHGETWINDQIIDSFTELHEMGLAHSVEAWKDNALAGGLYGVALRGAFFGESMFHCVRDASKIALVGLVERMRERGMVLLDVQFSTDHLSRFGTVEIPREEYLQRLARAIELPCQFGDMVIPPS